jgi:hypothetical protein
VGLLLKAPRLEIARAVALEVGVGVACWLTAEEEEEEEEACLLIATTPPKASWHFLSMQ